MKTALIAICAILILSLLGNYLQWRSAEIERGNKFTQNAQSQQTILRHQDSIKTAVARIHEVEARRIRDSLSYKSREIASNAEIQGYKRTIAKLRPLVQAKIDSFPDLREFVNAQDSTIGRQDSLIHSQELFCQLQTRDLQEIIRLTNDKFEASQAIAETWRQSAESAQKDVKTQKRKTVFWKTVSAVAVGGIAVLLLSPK